MLTINLLGPPTATSTPDDRARVPEEMMYALRQHGMHLPIRGSSDPRLDYPELLIECGWKRTEVNGGYAYRKVVDENPDTNDLWEQYYEMREDGNTLITRVGHKEQILDESPDGSVTGQIRTVD